VVDAGRTRREPDGGWPATKLGRRPGSRRLALELLLPRDACVGAADAVDAFGGLAFAVDQLDLLLAHAF
jgi:hypothetical protein